MFERRSVDSPLGTLTLCEEGGRLSALLFSEDGVYFRDESPLLLAAEKQLDEYFQGTRKTFDLPLVIEGSAFERAVFHALLRVEYGHTATYGELAFMAGFPRAARAVGNALHKNSLPILLPCHRIVAQRGEGNYAWGMEKKRFLLELEESR